MGDGEIDDGGIEVEPSPGGFAASPALAWRLRRRLARPWPRQLLVAVTAVVTFALTVAVTHDGAGEVGDPGAAAPAARSKPSRAAKGPADEHDLRVAAQTALPGGADMYVAVVDSGDAVYDDMTPGGYLMNVACAAREEAVAASLVVTVLPSGEEIPVEVMAGDGPIAFRLTIAEGGGLRTSPADLGDAVCQFSLRRR
ncbi:hypothetical protein [Phytomonospora endophytica]|uniref:Uncharacterized protein n=1 Tax=Phytomonospora endophytica TaxID=714109 RepID=A0A841FXN5_9ACTN|nr:hypothetical protein [Phytomonospora endophytica]MBB6038117.1 hypothetical protein [Phytomonospora endophytica]GIG67420.1 hypothetical protein Pen01_37150 [Phytomonospora endophytica]